MAFPSVVLMAVTDTGRVIVDVSVAIYGRVIVTQERRERGPGSFVQVADSAYPEEEVGTG